MKTNRLLLLTFTSLFMLGTSLYGQQEVDPSWFNPWPAPNPATAQTSRPQVAKHEAQTKKQVKTVASLSEHQSGKLHAKRSGNRRTAL